MQDANDSVMRDMSGSLYQPGDFVVPRITHGGSMAGKGKLYGEPDEVAEKINKIANHMESKGQRVEGEEVKAEAPVEVKQPKLKLTVDPELFRPEPVAKKEDREKIIDVEFVNDFGTIKIATIGVLESASCICLVFKNDRELRFVPKKDSKFKIEIFGMGSYDVWFPGFVMTWLDGEKQLMILIKTSGEETNE